MLVEFTVSNFRSFPDSQTFNMVSSKQKELQSNLIKQDEVKNLKLLKTAVIYGANASGKSNLIKAISTMKRVVIQSMDTNFKFNIEPFLLDSEKSNQSTEFEIILMIDGDRYQYGFELDKKQIYSEWLFVTPKTSGRSQRWFSREWDEDKQDYEWGFSSYFKGSKKIWQNATKYYSLFLSTAIQLNSEQLKPLYNWFFETLQIVDSGGIDPTYSANVCFKDEANTGKRVLTFLQKAGISIEEIKLKKGRADELISDVNVSESKKNKIKKQHIDEEFLSVKTGHLNNNNKTIYFNLHEESEGTQRLFSFAGPIIDVLAEGRVLFVDEMNSNLHPKLVEYLVSVFHSPKLNPNNAQLIFTTHETSILKNNIFRRDQIWFCDKSRLGETDLFSLCEFGATNKMNLESAYLSGKFGALPFIFSEFN